MLKALSIRHFRNLKQVDIEQLAPVNVFWGENGAGKTSILECVHCLATSRSFRTRKHGGLVDLESDQFVIFGRYLRRLDSDDVQGSSDTYEADGRLGIQRQRTGDPVIKKDGERVYRLSDLSQQFPVLVLNSDSFDVLLGGPAKRRQLIDWCLFHVKHDAFLPTWQRYQRVLKQRNDVLRRAKMGDGTLLDPWDTQLIALGEQLDAMRRGQLEALRESFEAVIADLQASFASEGRLIPPLKLSYASGYGRYSSLRDAIEKERDGDCRAGVTRYGPHRADLLFTSGGRPASELLSRGQLKTVVSALVIAQLRILKALNPTNTVWCVLDDLPAELDQGHRKALIQGLLKERPGVQLFLTSIEKDGFEDDFVDEHYAMFHVKQGKIKQRSP